MRLAMDKYCSLESSGGRIGLVHDWHLSSPLVHEGRSGTWSEHDLRLCASVGHTGSWEILPLGNTGSWEILALGKTGSWEILAAGKYWHWEILALVKSIRRAKS